MRSITYPSPLQEVLDWRPLVPLEKGLRKTVEYFSKELGRWVL